MFVNGINLENYKKQKKLREGQFVEKILYKINM